MSKFAASICRAIAVCLAAAAPGAWAGSPLQAPPSSPGHLDVLHTFSNGSDGASPIGGVQFGSDGALYGVTQFGGSHGSGTLFRITATGAETIVHDFVGATDGANPTHRPIQSTDGHFYGTTSYGGPGGWGTVYRTRLDGSGFEVVFAFQQASLSQPDRLVRASDGTLYVLFLAGGAGNGGVLAILPDGSTTVLHAFAVDGSEGWGPNSLLMGQDGSLWGTTQGGGKGNGGVAWHLASNGGFSVIHRFDSADGRDPQLWIAQAGGSFYGTTGSGGPSGRGGIFNMTAAGKVSIVYGFGGKPFEGSAPSGLTRTSDGALYGVTLVGGKKGGLGTVYKLSPEGVLTILHDFGAAFANGIYPQDDGPAVGADGSVYGVCTQGGVANLNNVFGMGNVFRTAP